MKITFKTRFVAGNTIVTPTRLRYEVMEVTETSVRLQGFSIYESIFCKGWYKKQELLGLEIVQ